MNKQLNVRISPETRRQLDELTARYGETESQVITRLIDREYLKGANAMLSPTARKFYEFYPEAFEDLGDNVGLVLMKGHNYIEGCYVLGQGYEIVTGNFREGRFDAQLLQEGKLVATYDAATDEVIPHRDPLPRKMVAIFCPQSDD